MSDDIEDMFSDDEDPTKSKAKGKTQKGTKNKSKNTKKTQKEELLVYAAPKWHYVRQPYLTVREGFAIDSRETFRLQFGSVVAVSMIKFYEKFSNPTKEKKGKKQKVLQQVAIASAADGFDDADESLLRASQLELQDSAYNGRTIKATDIKRQIKTTGETPIEAKSLVGKKYADLSDGERVVLLAARGKPTTLEELFQQMGKAQLNALLQLFIEEKEKKCQ